MNTRLAKLLVTLALLAQILTACNFGGHGVDVTLGHNNCATAACTVPNTKTNISIH